MVKHLSLSVLFISILLMGRLFSDWSLDADGQENVDSATPEIVAPPPETTPAVPPAVLPEATPPSEISTPTPVSPSFVASTLKSMAQRFDLPAMAGAVIRDGTVVDCAVFGVRKIGTPVGVTLDDYFHLGSCTKAMTDTLLAMLIEQGKLRWDSTLKELFPNLASSMLPVYQDVTVEHLMMMRAGMPHDVIPSGMTFENFYNLPGENLRAKRMYYIEKALQCEPAAQPGEKYIYSNAAYIILGGVAEQVAGRDWEDLMREMIFQPLGMKTAGFGPMGTPGMVDAPWQHKYENGQRIALSPDLTSDNPPLYGPAGRVHCSIGDWAKFILTHVNGEWEDQSLLKKETILRLHQAKFGGDYAGGWVTRPSEWAGDSLFHDGSNGMNFSQAWLAPKQRFAVILATNESSDAAQNAVKETEKLLIEHYRPVVLEGK